MPSSDSRSKQQPPFVEIRRYKRRQRKELLFVRINSGGFEETIATGRNHYRIDHEWDTLPGALKLPCHGGDDLSRTKQTGFDRTNLEIFEQHRNLLANHFRGDCFNPRNFPWNFCDDARHSGQSVNAERGKSLQVCLNTGAAAAIGTGDGECDRDCSDAL